MKHHRLTTGGLMIAVLIGLSGSAPVHGADQQGRNDDRQSQYGGSLDARQHGYEHAYRDGADRGRQDRESRTGYAFRANDYRNGSRGYERVFGSRVQYMNGYREGYKAGYDDGYYERAGRYGQLYGRRADGGAPGRADVYATRRGGSADLAFDVGYRDGITSGQQDESRNVRSNFRITDAYRNADRGYRASDGNRDAYTMQFRDGFERGYQDGYGRSRYATDGGGYFPTSGNTGAIDTRDGHGTPTRSLAVAANSPWTATNIRVNQDETLQFAVSGEIRFSPNPNDRAASAGSLDHKYVPGAPLPKAFAGALIGRIDNGRPFAIGNMASVRMPASGILYLGVNDDIVSDNSGQFQVVMTW